MKKSFFYLTLIAAMGMTFVSCSKDEEKDTDENRLNFANQLTQNSTSCTWEGYDQYQRKELGNWVDEERKSYVVIRFDRASTCCLLSRTAIKNNLRRQVNSCGVLIKVSFRLPTDTAAGLLSTQNTTPMNLPSAAILSKDGGGKRLTAGSSSSTPNLPSRTGINT